MIAMRSPANTALHRVAAPIPFALLLCASLPAGAQSYELHTFEKKTLSHEFWSEAAAFGDFDRDGHNDIVAGPYWYEGPTFEKRHEFYPARHSFELTRADGIKTVIAGFDGALGSGAITGDGQYSFVKVIDMNGDGWLDILTIGPVAPPNPEPRVMYWYENPGKNVKRGIPWKTHQIAEQIQNQSFQFVDLFKNSDPVLLCMSGGQPGSVGGRVGYFRRDPSNSTRQWQFHAISLPSDDFQWYTHGLGYGDVNADGRLDILHSDGWWEQPQSVTADSVWVYHPYPFNLGPMQIRLNRSESAAAPKVPVIYDVTPDGIATPVTIYGGSQMWVDDVSNDGLPDVITSIAAHGYGLAWWEQLRSHDRFGSPQFRRHLIINKRPQENKYGVEFSEMQALAYVDLDGDGLKDIVTGKRYWAHGRGTSFPSDPEANAAAVLYWFKQTRREGNTVEFVPYLIDDDSGAGSQITIGDVNGDGRPDIVIANRKGAFVFLQRVKTVSKQTWEKAQPVVRYPDPH